MNKFFKTVTLAITLLFASSLVWGQDDYHKFEGFGGYAYMNLDRGVELDEFSEFGKNRVNSHGFNGSLTYNFSRNWGAKFDLSLHTYGEDFTSNLTVNPLIGNVPSVTGGTFKSSQSDYQYMGGVQYKNNAKNGPKLKPFGHILAGVADQKFTVEETAPSNIQLIDLHSTDFAMKFGFGLDIKVHKNVDIRVFQFDYNPIWRGDKDIGNNFDPIKGAVRNNYMFTFGVAFH